MILKSIQFEGYALFIAAGEGKEGPQLGLLWGEAQAIPKANAEYVCRESFFSRAGTLL